MDSPIFTDYYFFPHSLFFFLTVFRFFVSSLVFESDTSDCHLRHAFAVKYFVRRTICSFSDAYILQRVLLFFNFPLNFLNVVIRLQTSRSLHHISVSFSASVQLEALFAGTSSRPPVCAATAKMALDTHANDPFCNERHEGMKTFQFLGAKMSLCLAALYIFPSAQSDNCRLLIAKICRKTRCHWQHLQLLFFTNVPGV